MQVIVRHQQPGGAYPACPSFSQYRHCWLRDGAFIAYAMDRSGQLDSAAAFHVWAARAIEQHAHHIESLLAMAEAGEHPSVTAFLPARFTLDGSWLEDGWPNFQLDGYGHWLWSLAQHLTISGQHAVPPHLELGARLAARYLQAFWQEPCYDAWEEYRSQLHTSTLASIAGGLSAISPYLGHAFDATVAQVCSLIVNECTSHGRFVKHVKNDAVDASLLWVSTPFCVVTEDDPLMVATVTEIERTLVREGGTLRYLADTYYGGGAWPLLTAWLGWYHLRRGQLEKAKLALKWIDDQREDKGELTEQVPVSTTNRRFLDYWTARWGPAATPLLWSHAMALILALEIDEVSGSTVEDPSS